MVNELSIVLLTAVSLLQVLPRAVAHDHGTHVNSSGGIGALEASQVAPSSSTTASVISATSAIASSYFAYPDFPSLMLAHIVLMGIAWFFILPMGEWHFSREQFRAFPVNDHLQSGVVLSLAHYRFTSIARISFLGVNGVGILLARIYNSKSPELYENNSHHVMGWAVSWIVFMQCIIGIFRAFAVTKKDHGFKTEEQAALIPVSAHTLEEHQAKYLPHTSGQYRYSHDSGHGTEPESSRSHSISSLQGTEEKPLNSDIVDDTDAVAKYHEKPRTIFVAVKDFFLFHVPGMLSIRTWRTLSYFNETIDWLILPLGFVTVVSGIVVYGGVFVSQSFFEPITWAEI